jgi:glycosyltransferase involved in cell wall biosynthesis
MSSRIAVLVPCRNEEAAVAEVVRAFRAVLPDSTIYVYDNNSTDRTAELAATAGAVVRREPMPGKGNVVRRMFADIDADIYLMVDGDGTYDAAVAAAMVRRLEEDNLDMVVGTRTPVGPDDAFRPGHRMGNLTLTRFVGWLFGPRFTDIFSGYRAFSRRFVKSFPALATGFEVETELTVHALELRMPVAEVPVSYSARREGSQSKLSTWRDGLRILSAILFLFKEVRPFKFFSAVAAVLALVAVVLSWPLFVTFFETGLVPRVPTAVLVTGIMVMAFFSLACGIVLDTVSRGRRESKRMRYLAFPPVRNGTDPH